MIEKFDNVELNNFRSFIDKGSPSQELLANLGDISRLNNEELSSIMENMLIERNEVYTEGMNLYQQYKKGRINILSENEMQVNGIEIEIDTSKLPKLTSNREKNNQQISYYLSKEIASIPGLQDLYWIPYAIEAYARTRESSLRSFGMISSINIDRSKGYVEVKSRSNHLTAGVAEIDISDLEELSLEKKIDTTEKVSSKSISKELQGAIDNLDEVEKNNRNRIMNTLFHIQADGNSKLEARFVGESGALFPVAVGFGIYDLDNKLMNRFSLAKATIKNSDIPFTEFELNLITALKNARRGTQRDKNIKGFESLSYQLNSMLYTLSKQNTKFNNFVFNNKRTRIYKNLDKLVREYISVDGRSEKIQDKIMEKIFNEKMNIKSDTPLEIIEGSELGNELEFKINGMHQEKVSKLKEIYDFVKEHFEDIYNYSNQQEPETGSSLKKLVNPQNSNKFMQIES